jgi:hypothetical protein
MLCARQSEVTVNTERLETGLTIMEQVQNKVAGLKEDLKVMMLQVEEKKNATGILITQVTAKFEFASVEKEKANVKAAEVSLVAAAAKKIERFSRCRASRGRAGDEGCSGGCGLFGEASHPRVEGPWKTTARMRRSVCCSSLVAG